MKIKRDELYKVLTHLKPGLAKNEIEEQTTDFIFNDDIVYTFNNELSICYSFKTGITGSVPAKKFYELIQKLKVDEIDIKVKKDELLIKAGRTQAGIKFNTKIKLNIPKPDEKKFKIISRNFNDALEFVLFSVSKDPAKFPLDCIHIDKNTIVSCDNFRFTHFTLDKAFKESVLIPADIVKHLIKYNIKKYFVSGEWIHFMDKNKTILNCRRVESEYPDTEQLLEVEGQILELSDQFVETITRSKIMNDDSFENSETISIEIHEGKIICTGEGKSGWIKEEEEIDFKGESFIFSVNPDFFREILNNHREMVIGENSILFDAKNFKHVLALTVK